MLLISLAYCNLCEQYMAEIECFVRYNLEKIGEWLVTCSNKLYMYIQ